MSLDPKYRWFRITLLGPKCKPKEYTIRGLTANELRVSNSKPDKHSRENYVIQRCVADSEEVNHMLGGTFVILLEHIQKLSGLDADATIFNEAVDWIKSDIGKMEAVTVCMVQGLTLKELRDCDPHEYAEYLLMGKLQWEALIGPLNEAFAIQEVDPDRAPYEFESGMLEGTFSWGNN